MDLWCEETSDDLLQEKGREEPECLTAFPDENILRDDRVLERLLMTQHRCLPKDPRDIFSRVQTEVIPAMRKVLTSWMLEVCVELNCEEVVFPLAVNYLDRILSFVNIKKNQLQLLGGVCLLIASKLRQCKSLHPLDLVFYSDNSFTANDVTEWEMLVLTMLNWDVSVVISTDFLDHLLLRLHLIHEQSLSSNQMSKIRSRAVDLCLYCSLETDFVQEMPSMVATSSLAAAILGVLEERSLACLNSLVDKLHEVTNVDRGQLLKTIKLMMDVEQQNDLKVTNQQVVVVIPTMAANSDILSGKCHLVVTGNSSFNTCQPETPTDLHEVVF